MSKVFYDHLVMVEELFMEIEVLEIDPVSKKEMKKMIDDIVHHKVLTRILDLLPKIYHKEFLERFYNSPGDLKHFKFLQETIDLDIHHELAKLSAQLKTEIRQEINKHRKKK